MLTKDILMRMHFSAYYICAIFYFKFVKSALCAVVYPPDSETLRRQTASSQI